jgi:iron(III) transport system permease protein
MSSTPPADSTSRHAVFVCLALAGASLAGLILIAERDSWHLLRNTLILSSGSALMATPVGFCLSYLLVRAAPWGTNLAATILVALLFIPLQLQLAGWDALFGKLGWETLAYGSPAEPFLHGMRGAIWVHAMAAIPWTTLFGGLGWLAVEPQWEEAALLEMPGTGVLRRILLPQAAPFLLIATLWAFLQAAGEMTVTNIYVVRTYAEELYNAIAADGIDQGLASKLLPSLLGTLALLFAAMAIVGQLGRVAPFAGRRQRAVIISTRQRLVASLAIWSILGALVAIPLGSLVVRVGMIVRQSPADLERVWSGAAAARVIAGTPWEFRDEFQATLLISATTASLAVLLALGPAWRMRRGLPRLAWGAFIAAIAVPGPVIGLAVIWLLNRPDLPGLIYLYDHPLAAPVMAMLIRALPLSLLLLVFGFASVGSQRLEAAALDGAGPALRLWRIALPQRFLVIAVAWLAAFTQAAGDLSCSILVLPPGTTTLQFRLFEKVHSGVEEQVAGIALVSAAIYAGLAFAAITLYQRLASPHQKPAKTV